VQLRASFGVAHGDDGLTTFTSLNGRADMKHPLLVLVLFCGACSGTTEPDLGGMPIQTVTRVGNLTLSGRTEIANDTVVVTLSVRNLDDSTSALEHGVCSFAVQGVGPGGATWDNRIPPDAACIGIGIVLQLDPGATENMVVFRRPVPELRATVPQGRYEVTIWFREDGSLRRIDTGSITL